MSAPSTIPAALARAAAEFGDVEAVVDGDVRWTFEQLRQESHAVAAALVGRGVAPGDRVALWSPNSARWIAASFGVYEAGAALVPINTRFKGAEVTHILGRSGARLLLASTDSVGLDLISLLDDVAVPPTLGEIVVTDGPPRGGAVPWDEFMAGGGTVPSTAFPIVEPDHLSDIVFTSGTTGAPKGAVLRHGPSVRTYEAWIQAVGLQRGDRYLCVYPFFHTAGLKSAILACVLQGATIVPHAVFDAEVVMQRVIEERITVLPGPPTVFQSIVDHPQRSSYDLSTLRLSVTGAATVPVEVIRRMRQDLGIATVVTGYGLTETTGTVSMCRHDDPPEVIAQTVGQPLDGISVRVVDDEGTTVEPGQPGEILVRGYNVMSSYFDDPEATASAFDEEGYLRTGDIGFVGDDGNIRITDRKKDMFIVGGFNAYPAEIEGILLTHPAVAQVAVVGMPDARLGEVGRAYVIVRPGTTTDETALIEWSREHMANFKVPRQVWLVDELPLTASGKVQRFRLRPA